MSNAIPLPQIFDLSAVQANTTKDDVIEMACLAKEFDCKAVFCLSCFNHVLREERERLGGKFLVGGTVGYPSGQMTTKMKEAEARLLLELGVDEVDMMVNLGFLLSGMFDEARDEIKAVKQVVGSTPLKVIVETPLLPLELIPRVAEIVVEGGAQWIKTGTGWTKTGTTFEQVQAIKDTVGDRINIKAAGGVGALETIIKMYDMGVRRFGVGRSAKKALEDYAKQNQ